MSNDPNKGRHHAGFVDQTAKTKEAMKAIDDEQVPRDFQGFVALYMRDRRKSAKHEIEVDGRLDELAATVAGHGAQLEATAALADGASGHSLDAQAKVGNLVVEMRNLSKRLEEHPVESKRAAEDAAAKVEEASTAVTNQVTGLIADVRRLALTWAPLVALVAGLVAGVGTWLGTRTGTHDVAKEAAREVVRDAPQVVGAPAAAPPVTERIIYLPAPTSPATAPSSAPPATPGAHHP